MKRLIFYLMALFICVSCSESVFESQPTAEMVDISFSCGGELVNVTESPMTKATTCSNDLYVFEFYYWDDYYNWLPYACFFTDNPSNYSVSFVKNQKYACSAVCVPNGKNLIAHSGINYGFPFTNYWDNQPFPKFNDKTSYGTAGVSFGVSAGLTTPKGKPHNVKPYDDECTNQWNNIDKYFGSASFIAENDTKISINMFRMMFAIKLSVENFTEGKIVLLDKYYLAPRDLPFDKVIEMECLPNASGRRGFTDDEVKSFAPGSTLNIKYIDKSGAEFTIFNKTIDIQRLTKYDISFDLKEVLEKDKMGIETSFQTEAISDTITYNL